MQVRRDHEEFSQCNPLFCAGSGLGSHPASPRSENQGGQNLRLAKRGLWAGIKTAACGAEKTGYRAAGQGKIFQGRKYDGFPLFPLDEHFRCQMLPGPLPTQPNTTNVSFWSPFTKSCLSWEHESYSDWDALCRAEYGWWCRRQSRSARHGTWQQGKRWKDRYSDAFCAAHTFAVDGGKGSALSTATARGILQSDKADFQEKPPGEGWAAFLSCLALLFRGGACCNSPPTGLSDSKSGQSYLPLSSLFPTSAKIGSRGKRKNCSDNFGPLVSQAAACN